jgi:hypothetical protein
MESFFVATLNMAALSHKRPAPAGTFRGSCSGQDSNKRNTLLASAPLFCGIYSSDTSLKQNCVFNSVLR